MPFSGVEFIEIVCALCVKIYICGRCSVTDIWPFDWFSIIIDIDLTRILITVDSHALVKSESIQVHRFDQTYVHVCSAIVEGGIIVFKIW